MPRHTPASASLGHFSTAPVGQTISGNSLARYAEPLDQRAALLAMRVEGGMRIAVAREETLEAREIGVAGNPTSTEPTASASISPTRRRMSARITTSPISAEPMIRRPEMGAVERRRGAALRAGEAGGQRGAAGKLADLAGEFANPHRGDRPLMAEPVAAAHVDASRQG